jgi:lysyl-tRNA synthetase, class II
LSDELSPPGAGDGIDPLRLEKLQQLRDAGRDPFAIERYERTHACAFIADHFDTLENQTVSVAGRITSTRLMGKAAFVDVTDASGRIQVYVRSDEIDAELYEDLKHRYDIGDYLGVTGFVFRTRSGEVSIHAKSIQLLAKALRTLPLGKEYETGDGEEKHAGTLSDTDIRYRRRYVDLVVNRDARKVLLDRVAIVRALRRMLEDEGFCEVETPVLQSIAGGAAARPFLTHHNALSADLHLRISLELYLKRLIVGDIEKVYEIGKVFRNEGIDTRHSPEFTMLEIYQAYANLEDIMGLAQRMVRAACRAVHSGAEQFAFQENIIDLAPEFERLPILAGIEKYAGIGPAAFDSLASAHAAMASVGLPTKDEPTVGGIIEKLHERFTQPNLIQPTFITDFPLETSPLAKKRADNPNLVRRFEVYMGAAELGNAFSEINDPIDQRERFTNQVAMRAAGDDEAHPMDEDFLRALEYGMPPTGGYGIGIDRLAILLTDAPGIRDVILFPQLKPESGSNP